MARFPDQRAAGVGGGAEVGIAVVAQAQGEGPIARQLPFVLYQRVPQAAVLRLHEQSVDGACISKGACRRRKGSDAGNDHETKILVLLGVNQAHPTPAGTEPQAMAAEALSATELSVEGAAVKLRRTQHAVRVSATEGAARKQLVVGSEMLPSLITFKAVLVSMPGMRVRSTPLASNSARRASKPTALRAGVLRLG